MKVYAVWIYNDEDSGIIQVLAQEKKLKVLWKKKIIMNLKKRDGVLPLG